MTPVLSPTPPVTQTLAVVNLCIRDSAVHVLCRQVIEKLEHSIASYKEEYAVLIAQAQAIKTDLASVQAKVRPRPSKPTWPASRPRY